MLEFVFILQFISGYGVDGQRATFRICASGGQCYTQTVTCTASNFLNEYKSREVRHVACDAFLTYNETLLTVDHEYRCRFVSRPSVFLLSCQDMRHISIW